MLQILFMGYNFSWIYGMYFWNVKVEMILKGRRDSIPSPSRSRKHLIFFLIFFSSKNCWTQQCFAFTPQANVPAYNLNFHLSTVLFISFQTLEMSCLWWTDSSQNFFEEIPNEKKTSSPHYLKILMKLSKHGIRYSLKLDQR